MRRSTGARRSLPLLAGIVAGFSGWIAVGAAGFLFLRTAWPAYALAEPHKAYSLAMMFSRLTVGVVCTIAAGYLATTVASGDGRAAWWLGGLLLLVSAPVHLVEVWADYPAWYHFAYLLPLMPIAGFGGRLAYRRAPLDRTRQILAFGGPPRDTIG